MKTSLVVLLIDDEPDILESFAALLEHAGHQPRTAAELPTAFPMIPAADVVITDSLGGTDGAWRAVVDRCQALGRPVVVFSADNEVCEEAGSMGIPNVGKPGSIQALLDAIEGFRFGAQAAAR